jgi:hypothetical protein
LLGVQNRDPLSEPEVITKTTDKSAVLSSKQKRWLSDTHLPRDYFDLNPKNARKARMAVFSSWYDLEKPNILCNSVDNYVASHRLWVDYYLKPDSWSSAIYYWDDPIHKYEMVRIAMSEPLVPSKPAKMAVTAARGSAKTITLVFEMCSHIAVARPGTGIVVSEVNKDRTADEIIKIRDMLENNEIIASDFGAVAPTGRYSGTKWNETHLDFKTFNQSYIKGISVMSKHRGRHPPFGVIDDPDDPSMSGNPDLRKRFFDWLFRTYSPMFHRGGKYIWIQTTWRGSWISYAMRGTKTIEDVDGNVVEEHDTRFDDWRKINFDLLRSDDEGQIQSIWPQYMDVDDYVAAEKSYGKAAANAEFRGIIMAEGAQVFQRHPAQHGFMWCRGEDGDYFLDLKTGDSEPWREWVKSLYVGSGGDFADSLDIQSDKCAASVVGVDQSGNFFVLDAYNRLVMADTLIDTVLAPMARLWDTDLAAWELAAMQSTVCRYARRYGEMLRREGFMAPVHHAIENQNQKKTKRIIGVLQPLIGNCEIRFLRFEAFTDKNGDVHTPAPHPRRSDYADLLEQIDGFTDRGAEGDDDVVDALHIALRAIWTKRGRIGADLDSDTTEGMLQAWGDLGVNFSRSMIPPEAWTDEMWREHNESIAPKVAQPLLEEHDPYDY